MPEETWVLALTLSYLISHSGQTIQPLCGMGPTISLLILTFLEKEEDHLLLLKVLWIADTGRGGSSPGIHSWMLSEHWIPTSKGFNFTFSSYSLQLPAPDHTAQANNPAATGPQHTLRVCVFPFPAS